MLWQGFPTYASTQTIFTILKADWYYLEENEYQQWNPQANFEVAMPGQHETGLALPWGGTSHPVWFKNDPRVSSCKVTAGVFDRTVMEGVVDTIKLFEEQIKRCRPTSRRTRWPRWPARSSPGCRRGRTRG